MHATHLPYAGNHSGDQLPADWNLTAGYTVSDGLLVGGDLVDPAGALADGLRTLASFDPEERRRRSASLRRHAESRLGLDRMLDGLDTFFRDTLSPAR